MRRRGLRSAAPPRMEWDMMRGSFIAPLLLSTLIPAIPPAIAAAPSSANTAYDSYIRATETRLAAQHTSLRNFLAPVGCSTVSSEHAACIERVSVTSLSGAMLHHWRATEFLPAAKAVDLDRILREVGAYPRIFAPQVERASATRISPD